MLDVFVIGGGPAGTLAALLLGTQEVGPVVNAPPGTPPPVNGTRRPAVATRVTLVEGGAPVTASPSGGRSFTYLIGPRGVAALARVPTLLSAVREAGVPSRPLAFTILDAKGGVDVKKDLGRAFLSRTEVTEPGSWLHRNAFLKLMYEALEGAVAEEGGGDLLRVRTGMSCVGLVAPGEAARGGDSVDGGGGGGNVAAASTPTEAAAVAADGRAVMTLRNNATGEEEVVRPDLVIGADGVRSVVRGALGGALGYTAPEEFTHHYSSPAADVAYRTLALKAGPHLAADGSLPAQPGMMYVCRGLSFNMGLLCVGSDPALPRIGTITQPSSSPLWRLSTVDEYWAAFEKNFPTLPLREMVADGAMEAFAAGPTVTFPIPTMPHALGGGVGTTGVALVGDAAHAFPPDLGQGVNAALEDVAVLVDLLRGEGGVDPAASTSGVDPVRVADAYDAARRGDVTALLRMMQTGAPYQYGQNKLRQALWGMEILMRVKLSNAMPAHCAPPIFTAINSRKSYSEIWRLEQATKRGILGVALAVAAAVLAAVAH